MFRKRNSKSPRKIQHRDHVGFCRCDQSGCTGVSFRVETFTSRDKSFLTQSEKEEVKFGDILFEFHTQRGTMGSRTTFISLKQSKKLLETIERGEPLESFRGLTYYRDSQTKHKQKCIACSSLPTEKYIRFFSGRYDITMTIHTSCLSKMVDKSTNNLTLLVEDLVENDNITPAEVFALNYPKDTVVKLFTKNIENSDRIKKVRSLNKTQHMVLLSKKISELPHEDIVKIIKQGTFRQVAVKLWYSVYEISLLIEGQEFKLLLEDNDLPQANSIKPFKNTQLKNSLKKYLRDEIEDKTKLGPNFFGFVGALSRHNRRSEDLLASQHFKVDELKQTVCEFVSMRLYECNFEQAKVIFLTDPNEEVRDFIKDQSVLEYFEEVV